MNLGIIYENLKTHEQKVSFRFAMAWGGHAAKAAMLPSGDGYAYLWWKGFRATPSMVARLAAHEAFKAVPELRED